MSTESAQAAVADLPASQAPAVVEELFQHVFRSVPSDELLPRMQGVAELDALQGRGETFLNAPLKGAATAELSRELLAGLARDESLSDAVEDACTQVQTRAAEQQLLGTVVAAGVIVNLTYLVMTTQVSARRDASGTLTWSVSKRSSPPDFVSSILAKLTTVVTGAAAS